MNEYILPLVLILIYAASNPEKAAETAVSVVDKLSFFAKKYKEKKQEINSVVEDVTEPIKDIKTEIDETVHGGLR